MPSQSRQFNLSISSGPTMLQENDKGGNFSQQESTSTVMYSTVYLPWFYVACCANVLFLVEEMSTSLRFTQQRLDQRTYLLKSLWIPPRLQEAAMLKEMWQCSAEFWHGDYLQLWISRFFLCAGSPWATVNQHKKAKSGMTLPLVRKAELFPVLCYKLKTHSCKKRLKSPSLNGTYSPSTSSTSAHSNLLLTFFFF